MNQQTQAELIKKALSLKELDKSIIKCIAEGQTEKLLDLISEYVSSKKWIKTVLMDIPFSVIKIDNPVAKIIIQKISVDKELNSDNVIKKIEKGFSQLKGQEIKLTTLTDDEISELESDLFYSWFSSYDYVRNLYEIGSLTLGISFPKNLENYVQDARSCYAFEIYNGVLALSRTILETCIREIYIKLHPNKRNKNNVIHMDLWKVKEMIREVSRGDLKRRLDEMYDKLGNIIHGHTTVGRKEARESFRDTLKIVHELYASHRY